MPVGGAEVDVSAMAGRGRASTRAQATGRSGSIVFEFKSGGKVARGDVLMVPKGVATAPAATDPFKTMPQVLHISFVNAEGGVVKGTMDPYTDPACDCQVADDVRRSHQRRHDRGDVLDDARRAPRAHDGPLVDDSPEKK